ncbi:MAG: energy-coupling factor transporter ATPase [Clostridia bacterium]|nr:energy-coupling factor transporter ATPase [Clostridia bacterium]
MIAVQGVSFTYPGTSVPALKNIDFTIKPGQYLAISGPNGSGKSTLARLLNALLRPNRGQVLVDGLDTRDEAAIIAIRRRVGMVFQDPDNQLVGATVEDDVAFGLENLGLPPTEIRQRVALALETAGLASLRGRPPHLLSGGQKQRVALAGIIAMEPRYLVLDEATAMLDPVTREEVLQKVQHLRQEKGIGVILITHLLEEALQAEQIMILKEGRILFHGQPHELIQKEKILAELGFKLPATLDLAEALRQQGLKIPVNLLSVEELARTLWKLSLKM